MKPLVKPPWPKIFRSDHQRLVHPYKQRFPRTLGDLKTDRLLCLALDDGGPLFDLTCGEDVSHLQFDQIAAPQLAVDGKVEQCQITVVFSNLKSNADRPNVFWEQRAFLSYDAALVPGRAAGANGR